MKALRYYGARDIRHEGMDDPTLLSERDALVKMTGCSICGSDLHIYHGHGFSEDVGFCVGHEAVGEVVENDRSRQQKGRCSWWDGASSCRSAGGTSPGISSRTSRLRIVSA